MMMANAFERFSTDHIDYLETVYAPRVLAPQPDWNARRLEASARSMLDGVAVWVRELRRPEDHQSPVILKHEKQWGRALRMAKAFDTNRRIRCAAMDPWT